MFTRREMLRLTGLSAGVAGALAALGGCAGSTNSGGPVEGAGLRTPRRGGTVRLAFVGSGATESLHPYAAYSPGDYARSLVTYDRLFTITDGKPAPSLAERAEPAEDAKSFTLTLRRGVTWQDGSPFTAKDVAFSLQTLTSPETPYPSELAAYLDTKKIEVTDEHTLRVPTLQPVGDPTMLLGSANMAVIKDGTRTFEAGRTVGTGPYRVTAFEPGRETRLTRYDKYWGGQPYADEIVLLSMDDAQARANAVRGGQADYASDLPFSIAKAGAGKENLEIRSAGRRLRTGYGFIMNMNRPLMKNPKVRMALRLAIDRQALVRTVFLGYGEAGNDLYGRGAQYFASDTPAPERDVAKAKSLLQQAGASNAKIVIRSSDYETGMNSATQLFVEQLRELGLDAQAQLVSNTEYFDPKAMMAVEALAFPLGPTPLMVGYTRAQGFPSLAFDDEELNAALKTAVSTTDEAKRVQAWADAQRVMSERGNWIVWGLGDVLSLTRKDVAGIQVREEPKYPYLGKVGFTG